MAAAPVEVEEPPVLVPVDEESVVSVEVPVEVPVAVVDLERVVVVRLLLALPEAEPVAEPVAVVALPEAPEGTEERPAGMLAAGS